MPSHTEHRLARRLLALGMAAGIVLTAYALAGKSRKSGAPVEGRSGIAAIVNGVPIPRQAFDRMVISMIDGKKVLYADEPRRRKALEMLVKEELAFQKAMELGLAGSDEIVRRRMVMAILEQSSAEALSKEPGEAELKSYYEANRKFFSAKPRIILDQVYVRVADKSKEAEYRERARQAQARLYAGEPIEKVKAELGDEPVLKIPENFISYEKLLDYVGPSVTRAAFSLRAGEVSEPVRSGIGYHVIKVVERASAGEEEFGKIREAVRDRFLEEKRAAAVEKYLANIRARADIWVNEDLMKGGEFSEEDLRAVGKSGVLHSAD